MRSTVPNWGRDRTDYRPELLELLRARSVGTAVEQANARDTALELRRGIMEAWAAFVARPDRGRAKITGTAVAVEAAAGGT